MLDGSAARQRTMPHDNIVKRRPGGRVVPGRFPSGVADRSSPAF